jgi:hypothetical protein
LSSESPIPTAKNDNCLKSKKKPEPLAQAIGKTPIKSTTGYYNYAETQLLTENHFLESGNLLTKPVENIEKNGEKFNCKDRKLYNNNNYYTILLDSSTVGTPSVLRDHSRKVKRNYYDQAPLDHKNFFQTDRDILPKPFLKISHKTIDQIFCLWNSFDSLPTHKTNPKFKRYQQTIKCLSDAIERYSLQEVIDAIKNYGWITSQPYTILRSEYRPTIVPINEFFKFSAYSEQLRNKKHHPLRMIESWFDECLLGKEYLLRKYSVVKKDNYPNVTRMLIDDILKSPVFPMKKEEDLLPIDKNSIIAASEKLYKFVDLRRRRLPSFEIEAYSICSKHMIAYCEEFIDHRAHPGYLLTDVFWRNFEYYLERANVLYLRS